MFYEILKLVELDWIYNFVTFLHKMFCNNFPHDRIYSIRNSFHALKLNFWTAVMKISNMSNSVTVTHITLCWGMLHHAVQAASYNLNALYFTS
jgi:hypothetical protein